MNSSSRFVWLAAFGMIYPNIIDAGSNPFYTMLIVFWICLTEKCPNPQIELIKNKKALAV
jgi:hypothetical protein